MSIMAADEHPNAEQQTFLEHFVRRLKVEVLEERQRTVGASRQEPLLDLVHGFPGTGKSRVIAWMRQLMEEGLGWIHGRQFVCLAFQNAMAAQINGFTIHHWSGIPARAVDGNTTGSRHLQSIKCQALRVIILDELSMDSAELLGALEYVVKTAIRVKGTYKKRKDGTTRVFGGVNIVMCVDLWQLQPVGGTWLCCNPLQMPAGRAQDALCMLWGDGPDTIRSFWALTQLVRCKDIWYNSFLEECRNGALHVDTYSFFHGLPTCVSPALECSCNADVASDPILGKYRKNWTTAFLEDCANMKALTH